MDYLVGGWSSSFVFRAQTGQPLTIGTNGITNPGGAAYNAIRIRRSLLTRWDSGSCSIGE